MLTQVDRFRRLLAGTALIASGGAVLVSLATKTVNSSDEKDVLDSVAANPGLNTISSLAQLVMAVLMLPAIFGLLHLLRHRGVWLGHARGARPCNPYCACGSLHQSPLGAGLSWPDA